MKDCKMKDRNLKDQFDFLGLAWGAEYTRPENKRPEYKRLENTRPENIRLENKRPEYKRREYKRP